MSPNTTPQPLLGAALGGLIVKGVSDYVLREVFQDILHRNEVPVPATKVPATAEAMVEEVKKPKEAPKAAIVPIKSRWASKINWVAAPGAVLAILTVFGLDLEPETREAILAFLSTGVPAIILLLRNFGVQSANK